MEEYVLAGRNKCLGRKEDCVLAGRRNVSWQEGGLLPGKKKEYVPAGKKCPCRKEECALTGRRNVPRQEGGIWSYRQKKYPGRKEECILTGGRHVSRQK
jgi:hypothetical protein